MAFMLSLAFVVKGCGGQPNPHSSLTGFNMVSRMTGNLFDKNHLIKPVMSAEQFMLKITISIYKTFNERFPYLCSKYVIVEFCDTAGGILNSLHLSLTLRLTCMKHVKCCENANSWRNASASASSPSVPNALTPCSARRIPISVEAKNKYASKVLR